MSAFNSELDDSYADVEHLEALDDIPLPDPWFLDEKAPLPINAYESGYFLRVSEFFARVPTEKDAQRLQQAHPGVKNQRALTFLFSGTQVLRIGPGEGKADGIVYASEYFRAVRCLKNELVCPTSHKLKTTCDGCNGNLNTPSATSVAPSATASTSAPTTRPKRATLVARPTKKNLEGQVWKRCANGFRRACRG